MLAIYTKNLTKKYKSKRGIEISVVDHLNLSVQEGEIFGFLGPNGAGKTTTIKMLLGITYPSNGEAKIFDTDVDDLKTKQWISYLPEKTYYYEYMTGIELMMFYASLFGIDNKNKCEELLEKVGLKNHTNKLISKYSKGMQQRIGLAQCLLNDPKLLFLDEPTVGLDPIAHVEIRDLLLQLKSEGKTIFISSHELNDIERICDRVAIINDGKTIASGELCALLRGGTTEIAVKNLSDNFEFLGLDPKNYTLDYKDDHVLINIPDTIGTSQILDDLRNKKVEIISVMPRKKRLEDLFIEFLKTDKQERAENKEF